MIVGSLRPDSWDLPLFLHVLGAMALFGGLVAVLVLALARRRRPEHGEILARYTFRTLLLVVLPAFVVMRVAAQWILSKEHEPEGTWVDVGFIVTEPGLILVVLPLLILGWLHARRRGIGWPGTAVSVLSSIYLAALVVAWWAMTTKPGA